MSLSHHIKALRALNHAFGEESANTEIEDHGLLLARMSRAYGMAADRLEAQNIAEAEAFAKEHPCTVDHSTMKFTTCPVCGVKRGG